MKKACGNCKFCKRDFSRPQGKNYSKSCCGNEDSYYEGVPTMNDDTCEEWEEK